MTTASMSPMLAGLDDKEYRRRIHAWTVNQPDEMRRLKNIGIDGIFSDDPPQALQILGAP